MKYKGISIIKNKSCKTWNARPKINGKQIYISARTQQECYNKLKKAFLNPNFKEIQIELNNRVNFHFTLKYMRFTFITRCQEQNIPELIIQSWCGHQIGSKVTKQVYTKYNTEDNNKYINVLNNSKFYSNSTQK